MRFGRHLKGQLNKAENDVDYNDNDDEEDSE